MINKMIILFFTNLVLLTLPICAEAFDPNESGDLKVNVLASASRDYIDAWVKTSSKNAIAIKPIHETVPNQTFYIAMIVTGYGLNNKGAADLTGDWVVQNPDGTEMFHEKNVFACKRHIKQQKGFLIMDPAIDLTFEEKDQIGVYVLRGIITDNILKKTGTGECRITLRKALLDTQASSLPATKDKLTMDDVGNMITYYYQDPQPKKVLRALKSFLLQSQIINDKVHFGPVSFFIATIAHDDKVFLDSLRVLKQEYGGIQKDALEQMISRAENFYSPDPNSPEGLDYLWSEFCATGKDEPVKKIISVLSYPEKGEDIILVGAAEWSLAANARQHKKVREIIEAELFSATGKSKEKLKDILRKI